MIREMIADDSQRVLEIYKQGIDSGNATFETRVPSWEEWDSKHLDHSRFVYVEGGEVLGWVALSPVSAREVYKGVAEVSLYVASGCRHRGIGTQLMEKIIKDSEECGIWTLFSAVFPENAPTMKLHERTGFRIIGRRERIARLNGEWRDTIILERRSRKTGI